MAIERKRILKRYIILCEGKDAELFLISFLNSKALRTDNRFSEEIQVMDFGGIDELELYLNAFMNMDGFNDVSRLLIIRDAEKNAVGAVSKVKKALESCKLPVPECCNRWECNQELLTAFTLLPYCDGSLNEGALEDLCWEILANQDIESFHEMIEGFIKETKERFDSIGAHEHKCRLHTYFSLTDKFVSLKIGEASKSGAFDWNSDKLDPLKQLILDGFNGFEIND